MHRGGMSDGVGVDGFVGNGWALVFGFGGVF